MGLEFLREHGASRVRPYPDQPELDLPDETDEPKDGTDDEEVDHGYEGRPWEPISVDGAAVDWDRAPRRFVDGCHVGHTIAWLQDAEGHPVPLMLAEIGGVCMTREGRDLRRSFQVVERVVAMVIDPFPWHEVEGFAIALADTGLRLLPAGLPRDRDRGQWVPSYDFEVMRKRAQNRSNYEMEVLEEVALCQDTEVPTVVDGRLEPRINSNKDLQRCPIVGVIKQQRKGYLHPRGWKVYYHLQPAERTPAFLIKGTAQKETIPEGPPNAAEGPVDVDLPKSTPKKKAIPVVSWYLKLDGAHSALPNWGVVRVEIAQAYFERIGKDFGHIDRLSHALYQMRCRLAAYRRGPVSLEPIVRAEESLRALFSPPSWLAQHFYRLTGL
jgi:hypothetical protein